MACRPKMRVIRRYVSRIRLSPVTEGSAYSVFNEQIYCLPKTEPKMKKILVAGLIGASALLASGAAMAHVDVSIGLGIPVYQAPPVVYAPAPAYGPVAYGPAVAVDYRSPYYRGNDWHGRGWHHDDWRRNDWHGHRGGY